MNLRSLGRTAAAVLVAATGLFAFGRRPSLSVPAPDSPGRPRLVLFVSVDQMRFDYLTRFGPLFRGGLKRLLAEGAVFTNARYGHANTETGPGHAVLLTGRHARDTGIIANEWYDRLRGEVNVVDDPVSRPLPGPLGRGASPVNTLGVTVGDLLKKDSPQSRVVGVSMKDRSAILMSGRRADAAYWYVQEDGRFGTSTYYANALPGWLAAWNAQGHVDALRGRTWTRLLPDTSVYERAAGPDLARGEWDDKDVVFPHVLRGNPPEEGFYEDVRRTPYADGFVLDVALRAMEAHGLGADDDTDVLAVGFSATDSIGHTYGAESQELMDQILRLDQVLGRLLDEVEARAGKGRVLFGLSADHGGMPLVESLRRRGVAARRAHPADIDRPVRTALAARFPNATGLVAAYLDPHFYLDLDAIARQGLRREDVEAVAIRAMLDTGLVDHVYTHADLLGDPPRDDPYYPLFRNSFFEPRSPHLMARLKEHVYLSNRAGGSGHGTPYEYDRHVPVAFWGAGIRGGRYETPCGPQDIAPTLAALLGLEYRVDQGQRVLAEALTPTGGAAGH